MSRIDRLNKAVARHIDTPPTPLVSAAPKDFEPGVQYKDGRPVRITTSDQIVELGSDEEMQAAVAEMGVKLPKGFRLVIERSWFNPNAWYREKQGDDALTRPVWRYQFGVVPAALVAGSDEDLEKLAAAARKAVRARPARTAAFDKVSMVIVLGDLQVGKSDRRGGTAELLTRLEHAKAEVLKQVKRTRPAEILLVDIGDGLENFESSPGADRTNDLQLMQQMRVFRRILMDWIRELAKFSVPVRVLSVPSNHCSVRRGKQNMAQPEDDMGIEVLTQLADICAENPEAYGHVEFWSPQEHEEALALELAGGKVLGLAHGHQKTRPEALPAYMAGQAAGRTPMGHADFAIFGHWHNFRVQTYGDDRWIFIAPTMDAGSSWFANSTGHESAPGVLVVTFDQTGWTDVKVHWAREGVDFETLEVSA